NRAWRLLEQDETVRVGTRVRERGKLSSKLVGLSGLLPDRTYDVHHLPMRHPLAARSLALLSFGAGHRTFHAARHAGFGANGDVRLHPALPEGASSLLVQRIDRSSDAVLVVPHIAVGHRDGVDVG